MRLSGPLFFVFMLPFAWGSDQWQLGGLELQVNPARVTAVKDVPAAVGYELSLPAIQGQRPALPADWLLFAEYAPPGGGAPLSLQGPLSWSGTLRLSPGSAEGSGAIRSWRIENAAGEVIRLFSTEVVVDVLGDIIIPQVEVNRLSYEELRELGVVLGDDNMVGLQVKLNLNIEESQEFENLELTVIKDENTGEFFPIQTGGRRLKFSAVSFGFRGPPSIGVRSTSELPEGEDQQIKRPRKPIPEIDALIAWPANIGYLNSFFKPMLILLNVAPEESGYVVRNLNATMSYPTQALRLATLESGPQNAAANITGPGRDGVEGNSDDENALYPQQKAANSWILEGIKPGQHRIDFDIRGTIEAFDGTMHPVRGNAAGFVVVRRPEMGLHFEVPSAVREFETFSLKAIFTLNNNVPVNNLQFSLDDSGVAGASVGPLTVTVNGQAPPGGVVILRDKGDQAVFDFELTSFTTGRVVVHGVEGGEDLGGEVTYAVKVAVGENGLPVSTLQLLMPQALKDGLDGLGIPGEFFRQIKVMAGRAVSLAQIPPGERENGFGQVSIGNIRDWIQALTYAVLKPRMGSLQEQRRVLAREFFFATLNQDRNLVAFLFSDSVYAQWSASLKTYAGDLADLPNEPLLIAPGMLLFENEIPAGVSGITTLGDPAGPAPVAGLKLKQAFDSVLWETSATSLQGWYFNGFRWGRWHVSQVNPGQFSIIWNGRQLQFVNNNARANVTWEYFEALPPRLLSVRQFGYECTASDQIDVFGRQLLLYFSEPVVIDEDFVKNLSIENNWVTRAQKVNGQIVQIWARNPLGLRERTLTALAGILSERGEPVSEVAHPIHLSNYWEGVTVEGRVFGSDGQPLAGADVGLAYATRRGQNMKTYHFSGQAELEQLGKGEFAQEVARIIKENAAELGQKARLARIYPFEFQSITNDEGYWEMDFWPKFRSHTHGILPPCQSPAGGHNCVDFQPDLLWQFNFSGRTIQRRIYGHYPNQNVVRDVFFPAQGRLRLTVPALPEGVAVNANHVVKVQLVDADEIFINRVMLPGETLEVKGLRFGAVSILAQGTGGFDAKSVNLDAARHASGEPVVLNPLVQPIVVRARIEMEKIDGTRIPAEEGFLVGYHYGAEFGGGEGGAVPLAVWPLAETAGQARLELPEGRVRFEFARDYQSSYVWRELELKFNPGPDDPPDFPCRDGVCDLGTLVYREYVRGEVTVTVKDRAGNPKIDYPVRLQDGLTAVWQNTDELGQTVFREVMVGRGKVSIPINPRNYQQKEFTLREPDQLSTSVDFELDIPYEQTIEVRDVDGSLVERAWAEVFFEALNRRQSGLTDASGRVTFSWSAPPPKDGASFRLEVQHPQNFRLIKKRFTRGTNIFSETFPVAFSQTGSADIGVVSEDLLQPLTDVWVEMTDASGNQFANVTGSNGRVFFPNLSPGDATVLLLPSPPLLADYQQTTATVNVPSGDPPRVQDIRLEKQGTAVPPRIVTIEGQVFDALLNPVDHPIKYQVGLEILVEGETGLVPIEIPIGSNMATTETGKIELLEVALPGDMDSYKFFIRAFDTLNDDCGTATIFWDRRTARPFLPVTLSSQVTTKVRVWDQLGNRIRAGQVKFEQRRMINDQFNFDTVTEFADLTEDGFTPSFTLKSGLPFCVTYNGPQQDPFCERNVIWPHEDGRPVDIVIKPLGQLEVLVKDAVGDLKQDGVFLQVFKNGKLWIERVLAPDEPGGVMTFPDLPMADYSILAYEIGTGYTDVWHGGLYQLNRRVELNLIPGEDITGQVLNTDGSPVANAQLILSRGLGTLRYSSTSVNGVSNQQLLTRTDENGNFTFPALTRGRYNLRVFDPFTARRKSVSFRTPQTSDLKVILRPLGTLRLTAFEESGALATGAKFVMFRGGRPVMRGLFDGVTGTWNSSFLRPGPVTILATSLDGSQSALLNTQVKANSEVSGDIYLAILPQTPLIGYQWRDTGDPIEEPITVHWTWEAPGKVASRSGTTVFPSGEPIRHRFLDGKLKLRAQFGETLEHRPFSTGEQLVLDGSENISIEVRRPRILEITVVDQLTGQPVAGARVKFGRGSSFTASNGKVQFRNVAKGRTYAARAVTDDGLRWGSGSVVIEDGLTTPLTIAVNEHIGDAEVTVTQYGDPFRQGFIELTGKGSTFSLALQDDHVARFRYLIEGSYRYTYTDPVRGVQLKGTIVVQRGNLTTRNLTVPGGGPLTMVGEYEGGQPLTIGQLFRIKTPIKTFTAEALEDQQGMIAVHWPALPEGVWRVHTPTIPKSRWNPKITIDHGVPNDYAAIGSRALPFWVRANVRFRDFHGFPISDFYLRRRRVSDGAVVETKRFTGGFGTMTLPFGEWRLQVQPVRSHFKYSTDIDVAAIGQIVDEEFAIDEDTVSLRFPVLKVSNGGFVNSRIAIFLTDVGQSLGYVDGRPFAEWDYLPVNRPLRISVSTKSGRYYRFRTRYERTFDQPGFHELDDILLETRAPTPSFNVVWDNNQVPPMPSFEISTDLEATSVKVNGEAAVFDAGRGLWLFEVTQFEPRWQLGDNTVTVETEGIHRYTKKQDFQFDWPGAVPITIVAANPLNQLPFTIDFRIDDPSFEIDQDRLNSFNSENGYLRVGNRRVDVAILPDGQNGLRYTSQFLQAPWKQGENQIHLVVYDLLGRRAGASGTVNLDVPDTATLVFSNLEVEDSTDITVNGIFPSGDPLLWQFQGGDTAFQTGQPFGFYRFYIVNNHPTTAYASYTGITVQSPTAANIRIGTGNSSWVPIEPRTVRLVDEEGLPLEGIPVRFKKGRRVFWPQSRIISVWDHGVANTDENGEAVMQGIGRGQVLITADFGSHQIEAGMVWGENEIELVDEGAGDILITVTDSSNGSAPLANLDVLLDGDTLGQTDANGQWVSPVYQTGREFRLQIQGQTADMGEISIDETITTVKNRLQLDFPVAPLYRGELLLSLDAFYDFLSGWIEIDGQRWPFPLAEPLQLTLAEGNQTVRILSLLEQEMHRETVAVVRNETREVTIAAPPQDQVAFLNVTVQDAQGLGLAGAEVTAAGTLLGTTDSSGVLELALAPGDYSFFAAHAAGSGRAVFTAVGNETEPVLIAASGFTPKAIANNILWLTNEPETLTGAEGAAVSRWLDLSGSGHHASQDRGDLQPTLLPPAQGEPMALDFNSIGQYINLNDGFRDFALGLTAYFVAKPGASRSNGALYRLGNGEESLEVHQKMALYQPDLSDSLAYLPQKFGRDPAQGPHGFQTHQYALISALQIDNDVAFFRNGVLLSEGATRVPTTVVRRQNYLGWNGLDEDETFQGQIAEVILFNRGLTQAEHDQIGAYLADKYELYHPQAGWIASYDAPVQDEIHARQLNGVQALAMSSFLAANPPVPAAGLAVWLDAGEGVQTDGEGRVTSWQDRSFRQNQVDIGLSDEGLPLAPQLVAEGVNSLPVQLFDETNGYFSIPELAPVFNQSTTVFAVFRANTRGVGLFATGHTGGGAAAAFGLDADGLLEESSQRTGLSSNAVENLWQLLSLKNNANRRLQTRLLGVPAADTPVTLTQNQHGAFYLGRTYNNGQLTNGFRGELAELLVYAKPLDQLETQTVEAYLNAKYALGMPLPEPVFEPEGGLYSQIQTVTLQSGVPGSRIHYTTDGSTPTLSSPVLQPGGSLTVTVDTVLKAMTAVDGLDPSPVHSGHYVIGLDNPNLVAIDTTKTIWTAGLTGQDYEGKDLVISGKTVTVVGAHQFNSLRLINGATMVHRPAEAPGLQLDITGDLYIGPHSAIDVSGRGYAGQTGPGAGGRGRNYGAGGGYGGRGGNRNVLNQGDQPGGGTYGDDNPAQPSDFGSGGGEASFGGREGGAGGGLVRLNIGGDLLLDGNILANGGAGEASAFVGGTRAGNGSGGGIQITANAIIGNGRISANGPDGFISQTDPHEDGYSGGGGGRIALVFDQASSNFEVRHIRVDNGYGAPEAGTLYFNGQPQPLDANLQLRLVDHFDAVQAGMAVKLHHTDGREMVAETTEQGLVSFDGLTTGETWQVSVPQGAANLKFELSGYSGSPGLYARINEPVPSDRFNDYGGRLIDGKQVIEIADPLQAQYHIGIYGFQGGFSNATLKVTFDEPPGYVPGGGDLQNGSVITGLSGAYREVVPFMLEIGDWSRHLDGSTVWVEQTQYQLEATRNFDVLRVYDTIPAYLYLYDEDFHSEMIKPVDLYINGELAFENSLGFSVSGQGPIRRFDLLVRRGERFQLQVRYPGWETWIYDTPAGVSLGHHMDFGIRTMRPKTHWTLFNLSAAVADGGPLRENSPIGYTVNLLEPSTGQVMEMGSRFGNSQPIRLEELRVPGDGSVIVDYEFRRNTTVFHQGTLEPTQEEEVILLPIAVLRGALKLADGQPVTETAWFEDPSDLVADENGHLKLRMVAFQPNNTTFRPFLTMRTGLDLGESVINGETLVTETDLVFAPHGLLTIGGLSRSEPLEIYQTPDLGKYHDFHQSQGFKEGEGGEESGLLKLRYVHRDEMTWAMPLGHWSIGNPLLPFRGGMFENLGDTGSAVWDSQMYPAPIIHVSVDATLPQGFESASYTLYMVQAFNPADVQARRYGGEGSSGGGGGEGKRAQSFTMQLGEVYFILAYEGAGAATGGGGGGEGKTAFDGHGGFAALALGKEGGGAISWFRKAEITQSHLNTGVFSLDFSQEIPLSISFSAENSLSLMPATVEFPIPGDGGGSGGVGEPPCCGKAGFDGLLWSWGENHAQPLPFFYSPLGWLGHIEAATAGPSGDLAWRFEYLDFTGQLGGSDITVPFSFTDRDPVPSGPGPGGGDGGGEPPCCGKRAGALGMSGIGITGRFMFGLLHGEAGASVVPQLVEPSFQQLTGELTFKLPSEPADSYALVFPMRTAEYSDGAPTAGFEQNYIGWRDQFDPASDPLWQGLPAEWRATALNWQETGAPVPLPEPLSYWSLDDALVGEGDTGDVLNRNPGTNFAVQTGQAGQAGESYYFNGAAHIAIAPSAALDPTNSLTLAFWMNAEVLHEDGGIMVYGNGDNEIYSLETAGGAVRFRLNWPGESESLASASLDLNRWYHVALVFESGVVTLYLDGLETASATFDTTAFSTLEDAWLGLGLSQPGIEDYFQGYLDEIAIWHQSLDAAQISEVFQTGLGQFQP